MEKAYILGNQMWTKGGFFLNFDENKIPFMESILEEMPGGFLLIVQVKTNICFILIKLYYGFLAVIMKKNSVN